MCQHDHKEPYPPADFALATARRAGRFDRWYEGIHTDYTSTRSALFSNSVSAYLQKRKRKGELETAGETMRPAGSTPNLFFHPAVLRSSFLHIQHQPHLTENPPRAFALHAPHLVAARTEVSTFETPGMIWFLRIRRRGSVPRATPSHKPASRPHRSEERHLRRFRFWDEDAKNSSAHARFLRSRSDKPLPPLGPSLIYIYPRRTLHGGEGGDKRQPDGTVQVENGGGCCACCVLRLRGVLRGCPPKSVSRFRLLSWGCKF